MLVIGFPRADTSANLPFLALSLSVSPLAWAGDDLSNGTIDKLAEPTRIAEELSQSETGRVRIIVEFAAPAMPEASALADGPTADAAPFRNRAPGTRRRPAAGLRCGGRLRRRQPRRLTSR